MHSDIFYRWGLRHWIPWWPTEKPRPCQLRGFSNAKTIRGSAVTLGYVGGTEPTGDKTRSSFSGSEA